jgi:hypothetical protein
VGSGDDIPVFLNAPQDTQGDHIPMSDRMRARAIVRASPLWERLPPWKTISSKDMLNGYESRIWTDC